MVQKRGSGLALEFLDKGKSLHTLTYDQFYACSSRLSKRILQSLDPNLATTPIIPLLIPQSPELYVSWLGILQAGAAVCPISIDAPAERVGFIVEDVSADIVITVKGLAAVLSQVHRPLVVIFADDDPDADGASAQAPQNDIQPNPESLAYVMYTSGSTGLPKGVGLSHRAATQALLAHEEHIPHFSRFLQFAAPTFDVSVFEIFFPLFRGATLVACERSVMLNDLVGVINELRVDAAELTPTVAGELLRKKERVPSLKVLLTIGEMLTRRVIDEFGFSSDNSGLLYAMYGPTEATIHCTIAPKLPNYSHVGNIGVPLRTVSAFILPIQETIDEELNVLPLGCIGELAVGGPQLANGYLNRPDENRKAFIESREYGRLYRTGDMARIHPNGELECLGRLSSGQIKLRGQRMEIGEVESTIYKTAGVRNVAVCVVEGILVAFISGEDDPDSQIVRQVCEKWLPKFMVPSDFVHMNELPRLASGKVDRKTLQNDYIRARGSDDVVPDTYGSDLERKIALCAGRILSAKLEASSSLTSLGLDSLKAIKLSSQLRATAINVDVVSILEADSVQGIVRFAEKASELQSSEAPITRLDSWKAVIDTTYNILQSLGPCSIPQDVIPCSPIQVGMIAESMQNKSAYSNLIELRFGQGITADEVCNTFCSVAHGNEILRSSFIEVNQPEHPYACVIWESLDKTVFTECDDFRYEIKNDTQDQLLRPFQVQLKSHDSQVRALIRIHHAIYDGWSWEHIMSDLHAILDKRQGKTRPQYRAFVDYVGKYLCSESKTSDVDYWRDKLQSCSPSQWPNFQDRDGIPRKLVVTHRTFKTDLKTLDAAVLNLRISRQTIFQGALGYLLGEYNGATDTIFGSVSSGRTIPVEGIEDIVGPCINTLPIRLNLENFRSIQDLLAAVHSQNRKTLAHGLLPLRDIKAVSGIDPTIPLFDTLFVWQDTTNDRLNHSTIVHQVASADSLEFSLTLEFEIRNGSICARATFQETILPLSQVDIFLEQLEELASIFMTESKLNLENVHEKLPTALLSAENVDFTKHDGLPSLSDGVSGTAKLDPERIAIEFLESFEPDLGSFKVQRLTYSGLDILSDRLANQLRLLAVVPGSLVCVYLEKSVELYVSILAVIKAGAGYVPITPQTPAQRVHTIITEAKCTVCVTNSDLTETAAIPHGVVAIDSNGNQLGQYEKPCPKQSGDMPSVAYVIFTSGSTGVPKGVLVSHDNMRENIAILSEIYPATPGSKMLQACSPAFDG